MRIIIRGATEIEIILPAGVEPPTVGCPAAVAGEASTGTVHGCTASSPGSPTDEAEVARVVPPPTVLDEATVAALLTKVGDQVREAVANPPPVTVIDRADELDLRRPAVEEDNLAIPAFLRRES